MGLFIVNASLLYFVALFGRGNDQLGFTLAVAVYGLLAAGLFYVTFKTCKERVVAPPTQDTSLSKDLRALTKNLPWLVMIVLSILCIMWISIRNGVAIHFFKYASGSEHYGSLFLSLSTVTTVIGILLTSRLVAMVGSKKLTFVLINLICAVLIAIFFFIDPSSIKLIMAHQLLVSFCAAPLMPVFWSMIADTADYGAWKLGQRSTGLLF